MFHAEIINDVGKHQAEVNRFKETPIVSHITQQQMLDKYYQMKMDVKRLMEEEVGRLRAG